MLHHLRIFLVLWCFGCSVPSSFQNQLQPPRRCTMTKCLTLVPPFMFIIRYLHHGVAIILNFALFGYFTTDRFHYELYPHLARVLENGLRDPWKAQPVAILFGLFLDPPRLHVQILTHVPARYLFACGSTLLWECGMISG